MGKYREVRKNLGDKVRAQLEKDYQTAGVTISDRFKIALHDEAEELLDEFERLSSSHTNWRAIKQSFWGSWLYTASVAAIPLVIYIVHQNFGDLWKRWFP